MEEEIKNLPDESTVEEENTDTFPKGELSDTDEDKKDEEKAGFDYEQLARADLAEIQMLSPEFLEVSHLSELPFARRFAELRELGLSVKEALFATLPSLPRTNGKAHLQSSVPRAKGRSEESLSTEEMRAAKDLFYGLSEKEINALYRRVSAR